MVNNEGISVSAAARECGIPRQTLKDKISCRYVHERAGRPTQISAENETSLINNIHGRKL